MLQPHWGKLATKMKGAVKVAYWDTETGVRPPAALGEIRGTPTMKVFVPRKKSRKNKKTSMDYNGPRELKDMKAFAEHHMPNYVEAINGDAGHAKFLDKAEKHGLPVALLFSKSKATSPVAECAHAKIAEMTVEMVESMSWHSEERPLSSSSWASSRSGSSMFSPVDRFTSTNGMLLIWWNRICRGFTLRRHAASPPRACYHVDAGCRGKRPHAGMGAARRVCGRTARGRLPFMDRLVPRRGPCALVVGAAR